MFNLIIGAVIGAVTFGFVLRNNPDLAIKLLKLADKIDDALDNKKGKSKK